MANRRASAWLVLGRRGNDGVLDKMDRRGARRESSPCAGEVRRIRERLAKLPVLDRRLPEEIVGCDEHGVPR
jgi:hypothetical protein